MSINLSIKQRLILISMVSGCIPLIIALLFVIYMNNKLDKKISIDKLLTTVDVVSNMSTAALVYDDEDELQDNLAAFNVGGDVISACIYNLDGQLKTDLILDNNNSFVCQNHQKISDNSPIYVDHQYFEKSEVYDQNNLILVKHPIYQDEYPLGYMYVTSATLRPEQRRVLFAKIISSSMLLGILLSYLMARSLHYFVSTPYKIKESELHEHQGYMLSVARLSPVGLFKIDESGKFQYLNSKGLELTGLMQDELKKSDWLDIIYKSDRKGFEEKWQDYLNTDNTGNFEFECRIKNKNQGYFWGHIAALKRTDNFDHESSFYGTLIDISDRKSDELELERYRNHLENLVDKITSELEIAQNKIIEDERMVTIGKLSSMVSHEIRNPLSTIRIATFQLKQQYPSIAEGLEPLVEKIDRNIDRCDRIISEMLDHSKPANIVISTVNIDHWLKGVINEFNVPKIITIKTSLSSDAKLSIDVEKLRRVVINILDNACQAIYEQMKSSTKLPQKNDRRKDTIEVISENAENGVYVHFKDDGIGMTKKIKDNLFKPLYSTKTNGVGLGMSIVKKIIEEHSGQISVTSEFGKGSCITLFLPLNHKA